jgi:uncharacterized protein YggE
LLLGLGFVAAVGVGLSTTRTQGQPAGAPAVDTHKKITVTGVGTVAVKPDTARISFAVKGTGNDFKAAVADCDKKAAAVKKALEDLKLGGLEIKSGPIHIVHLNAGGFGPGAGPFPGGGGIGPGVPFAPPGGVVPPPPPKPAELPPPPPAGIAVDAVAAQPPVVQPGPAPQPFPGVGGGQPFPGPPGAFGNSEVSRTCTVIATFGKQDGAGELKDIVPTADKILAAAVTAGATEPPVFPSNANPYGPGGPFGQNNASRIELYKANVSQLRQDALKLAVADAVANAKAAAGVANLTAKDIVTISDQNNYQYGGLGLGGFGAPGMPSTTGRGEVQGEMELIVQVSVTFSY